MSGFIRLRIGPMFSSKTRKMLDDLEQFHYRNKKCVVVSPLIDTRYKPEKGGIVDNKGQEHAELPVIRANTLTEIAKAVESYDVIGVDEVGFFDDLLILNDWANKGKIILAAGIDGDDKQRPFKNILQLIPLSEEVIKQRAVCKKCYADASFTIRTPDSVRAPTLIGSTVDVGGADKYMAVCRKCCAE